MDWKNEFETGQQLIRDRKFEDAIAHYKNIIESSKEDLKVHYWALKEYADIVGYLYYKDYFGAIDIYQKVINEYEEEDGLYEMCQVEMSKTYLLCGMEMIESHENMIDLLTPYDGKMEDDIRIINEKREDFITGRAEMIYKSRM